MLTVEPLTSQRMRTLESSSSTRIGEGRKARKARRRHLGVSARPIMDGRSPPHKMQRRLRPPFWCARRCEAGDSFSLSHLRFVNQMISRGAEFHRPKRGSFALSPDRLAKSRTLAGKEFEKHESRVYATAANRLAELVEGVGELHVDRDDKRQILTLHLKDRGMGFNSQPALSRTEPCAFSR